MPRWWRCCSSAAPNPNGACACDGGETPLWVAVGANERRPSSSCSCGMALTRTRRRSPGRVRSSGPTTRLRRHRVPPARRRRDAPATCPVSITDVPAQTTGIKTIDLWCPLPAARSRPPDTGLRARRDRADRASSRTGPRARGRDVVWTGFAEAPTDLGDIHHALAEADLVDQVSCRWRHRPRRSPSSSRRSTVASPLPRTAPSSSSSARRADSTPSMNGSPRWRRATVSRWSSLRSTARSDRRARTAAPTSRRSSSTSSAPDDGGGRPSGPPRGADPATSATAALAERARTGMTDALDEYLAQPFYVAEPFTGRTGELVAPDELHDRVHRAPHHHDVLVPRPVTVVCRRRVRGVAPQGARTTEEPCPLWRTRRRRERRPWPAERANVAGRVLDDGAGLLERLDALPLPAELEQHELGVLAQFGRGPRR